MQPVICSRCHKNVAVIFITRIEGGQSINEGLCLKCARELHIKPVDDVINKMGISDDELDGLSSEMMEALNGADGLMDIDNSDADSDEEGKTATFPFLNRLFGTGGQQGDELPEVIGEPASFGKQEQRETRETRENGGRGGKRKFLDNYCINLTVRARANKLDTMIGRKDELERVIQILNRRQKNNPCLIGEPGVGKTAIAEGLAQSIAMGDVPYKLRDKEVYLLDLTSLVAGTQFRGQFESRMKGLIEEIRKMGNIILVIDEVHNL
ncbi:MAG: ATP-dependent Clp protease ATP-binding subunit, partial [Clostridia bacterium]|nr:ATP-dependent Clp protease ATP-binding subunit [Clostridia bacterium]